MGIVIKQSIRNVIITSSGFGIGAVNTLFLFTNFLEKEYYGLVSYLISTSNLLWPLLAFGVYNTVIKYYSSYTDTEEQNRFMNLMLFIPLYIACVIGSLGVIFYERILDYFEGKNDIVQPFVWAIFVLAIVQSYFEIFFSWARVKLKSVFGTTLKELFIRICTTILLFLVHYRILTVTQFIYFLIAVHVLRMLIMMGYAFSLHRISFSFSVPNNYVSVIKYSSLILIAGSVAALLIDLDKNMIERYLPIENVAKYAICAYIASVIIIPFRAMHQITYPLVANHINNKQFKELQKIYKKSALNLLIISGFIFVLILCNVKELFEFIPDSYDLYIWVVIFIGLAKLTDNIGGINNAILYNSDYYRMILYVGIGMVIIAIVLNLICIPLFGITGAAFASFIAMASYNAIKLWIVHTKYKMHPFSNNIFITLVLIALFSVGFYFWDFGFHPFINIVFKSTLIAVGYVIFTYFFHISLEVNTLIDSYIERLRR